MEIIVSSEESWGEYEELATVIEQTQAATVRITRSTAVMISDRFAITAAHSPLDENNEITPGLTVQNLWGEQRDIINVYYDVVADFAIVELETPFVNSYAVKLANAFGEASQVFIIKCTKIFYDIKSEKSRLYNVRFIRRDQICVFE